MSYLFWNLVYKYSPTYAVADGGAVYIRKGFMTWDEFADGINFDALIDKACVFHFRFATHGSTSPGNCHPFPVGGNLKRQKTRTDVAIAHNGIVHVKTNCEI